MKTTYLIIPASDATWAQPPAPYAAFDVAAVHEIDLQLATVNLYQVLTGDYDGVKAEILRSRQARLGPSSLKVSDTVKNHLGSNER